MEFVTRRRRIEGEWLSFIAASFRLRLVLHGRHVSSTLLSEDPLHHRPFTRADHASRQIMIRGRIGPRKTLPRHVRLRSLARRQHHIARGINRIDRYCDAPLALRCEVGTMAAGTDDDLCGFWVETRTVPIGAAPKEAQIEGRETITAGTDNGRRHSSNLCFVGLRRLICWQFWHAMKVGLRYSKAREHLLPTIEAFPSSLTLGPLIAEK
mmetsp:Transcript_852/g.1756  ORF Transcript_852/g.1756 Transcript_852/m.1756 type:complete len:210 (-) Transcript_852:310-939(-)